MAKKRKRLRNRRKGGPKTGSAQALADSIATGDAEMNASPMAAPESSRSPLTQSAPDALIDSQPLWDRYVFGDVAAVRPYLLLRCMLLLLAFDCWIDLIPHAGRYGVGGFNVSHFAMLDWLPTPTPGVYIGAMLLTGWLALVMAIRPVRLGLGLLFGFYTYGWSMSMLDSYQHHYLVSLLLFSCIFFPTSGSIALFEAELEPQEPLVRWRTLGGAVLALTAAELVLALCEVSTPLIQLVDRDVARIGLRAAAVLLGFLLLFFAEDRSASPRRMSTSAWGYVSLCITCAIVYFYTAITKLEPDWRQGDALRRLGTSDSVEALKDEALTRGLPLVGTLDEPSFWALLAQGAIAVQLFSCVGFLVAARQDSLRGYRRWIAVALGLAPLSFHIGAEKLSLSIGWFSYYMLLITAVVFTPIEVLRPIGEALTVPARWLYRRLHQRTDTDRIGWGLLAAGAAIGAATTAQLDLPGAAGAAFVVAALLIGGGIWSMRRGHYAEARGWGLGALVAAACMWLSIAETDVRYDYYRFVGGDHKRRGELAEALEAYSKANRYVVHPWCVQTAPRDSCHADSASAEVRARQLDGSWTVRASAPDADGALQYCVEGRATEDECFRSVETALGRAEALGREWNVVRTDRSRQEAEVRELLARGHHE